MRCLKIQIMSSTSILNGWPFRARSLPNSTRCAPPIRSTGRRIVEWSKANRGELEGVYTGPANSKVRDHIYRIWMDIIRKYPVDGMHFDYVRLASPDFDYSRTSIENFHAMAQATVNLPRTESP